MDLDHISQKLPIGKDPQSKRTRSEPPKPKKKVSRKQILAAEEITSPWENSLKEALKEISRLNLQMMEAPSADPQEGIDQEVLQTTLDLGWEYSINGIEGVRVGHILFVGPSDICHAEGEVKGRNTYGSGEPCYIHKSTGNEDVKIEMNQDGAHIINGADGRVTANKFYSSRIASSKSGGSGAAAAKQLSTVPNSVVFKISADGSVKEFRGGELFKTHCGCREKPSNSSSSCRKEDSSATTSEDEMQVEEDRGLPHRRRSTDGIEGAKNQEKPKQLAAPSPASTAIAEQYTGSSPPSAIRLGTRLPYRRLSSRRLHRLLQRVHPRRTLHPHPQFWKIVGAVLSLVLVALFFYMVKTNALVKVGEEEQQFRNELGTLLNAAGQLVTDADNAEGQLETMIAKVRILEEHLKEIPQSRVWLG